LRNQGNRFSIAAFAAVPSAPIDRSIRRTVSGWTLLADAAPALRASFPAACRFACTLTRVPRARRSALARQRGRVSAERALLACMREP
jgi:hypothetical protein